MTIPVPFVTPFVNIVTDYGAVPDNVGARAANSKAFKDAQNDMKGPTGHPVFVPAGTFYLAETLRIERSLELFGTGIRGKSVLMFPTGASLLIVAPTDKRPDDTGVDCVIRDIRLESEDNWIFDKESTIDLTTFEGNSNEGNSKGTPGIRMEATASIERVFISGFTGTAIEIYGDIIASGTDANMWRVHDVYINKVGGHGVHTRGSDANGGLCSGAKIIAIGGNGIYDSPGTSTYVGCYAEEAKGRGYLTGPAQATFVGCFNESGPVHIPAGGGVWIGGSSAGFTPATEAFVVQGFNDVHPFVIMYPLVPAPVPRPGVNPPMLRLLLGYKDSFPGANSLFGWKSDDEGGNFWLFRWRRDLKVWSTELGNVFHIPDMESGRVSYHTGADHLRGSGVQGFPSLLLGGPGVADDKKTGQAIRVEIAANAPPAATTEGVYQRGDLVYHAPSDYDDPAQQPEYIGWVCVDDTDTQNLKWKRFGKIE